jgi:low temperature requirement protein LtrA
VGLRANTLAFLATFLGARWRCGLIYFNIGQERGALAMKGAAKNSGVMWRAAYTYVHLIIVAGIIVTAVADEFVLMPMPTGHIDPKTRGRAPRWGRCFICFGCLLFKRATAGWFPLSHIGGHGGCCSVLLPLQPFHGRRGRLSLADQSPFW